MRPPLQRAHRCLHFYAEAVTNRAGANASETARPPSSRQRFAVDLAAGTALYSIVLAFFNDYTDWLRTSSYSVTFALAVVMYALTALTFALKGRFARWHKAHGGLGGKPARAFALWLILFSSKFVFLAVIEWVFPRNVEVTSVIGLIAIIAAFTIIDRLARWGYEKLG